MTVWGHYYDDDREVEEATHAVPWNEKGSNGGCYFCWLEWSWCGESGLLTAAVSPLLRARIAEPKVHPVSPAYAYFLRHNAQISRRKFFFCVCCCLCEFFVGGGRF